MYPELLKLGPVTIYSWGFLFSIAVIVGTFLVLREAKKYDYDEDKILNLIILLIVGGLVGSRLFYIFVYDPKTYLADPLSVFKLWEGGLVWYGGLIGAVIVGAWYVKKVKLPFWPMGDLVAPYVALGYGIVRIGCFLNGCCYGTTTEGFLGIVFPHVDDFARYPTQIFSSLFGFALFFFLLFLRRIKRFDGEVLLWGAIIYAVGRAIIESFRDNLIIWEFAVGQKMLSVTVSQLVSVIVVIVAGSILWRRRRLG